MASLLSQGTPAGGWSDTTGSGDSTEYILGTGMQIAVAGQVTGIWYFVPSVALPTNTQFAVGLTNVPSNGTAGTITVLVSEAETKPVTGDKGTWKFYPFTTPQSISAGQRVQACVRTNRYALKSNAFTSAAVTNGNLTAWQDANSFPNGAFWDGALGTNVGTFPSLSFDESFYGIDLEFTAAGAAAAVPPRSRVRNMGALLQV